MTETARWTGPTHLELLAKAPDPASGARLTTTQITAALKRARRRTAQGGFPDSADSAERDRSPRVCRLWGRRFPYYGLLEGGGE
ncbi:MAG: hypothetical protein ACXVXO_05220, partial [Mycobacteriaceae bacterium]